MATAAKLGKIVPEPEDIILALTETEAGVLKKVLGHVTGSETGPRRLTSNIYWALIKVGVASANIRVPDSIYLEEK
ncbi:hypothetical protein LCGC14_0474280 [marine sediment metagenome]|uniref:Uncharacterized protein n=1 Tax=marine sediment metagenome TaxID=412755 RepID=A0A0F9VJW1_9ZZZZ